MNKLIRRGFVYATARRGSVGAYALILSLTLVAHFLRLVIAPLDAGIQYVTFFPTVALAAVIGGFGPGMFSALLGVSLASFYFWPPYAAVDFLFHRDMLLSNAVFLLDALLVCSAIEAMHRYYGRSMLAEAELREADRRKDEFLAVLGHELRNPLAAIRNCVEISRLADQSGALVGADERRRRSLGIIDRQSRHMVRLVNDLLDVTRVARNKLELLRQPVDLRQCLEETVGALQSQLDAAGLQLRVEGFGQPLTVDADPQRLVQMLDNLLRNAIKFTDPGGSITVSGQCHGKQAQIRVRDTGIGIDPDAIDDLFEPYRQAAGDHRAGALGLGLGLALVRRLADLHGGAVSAHSDGLGKGSEFTLLLPLAKTAQAEVPESVQVPLPPRRRVLVVDDEADVADSFALLLQTLGQEVTVAGSADSALRAVAQSPPDIAFLDLSMPGVGGVALSRQLRERFPIPALTLVAVSGHASTAGIAQGGAFQYHLLKPVTTAAVHDLLQTIAGQAGDRPGAIANAGAALLPAHS